MVSGNRCLHINIKKICCVTVFLLYLNLQTEKKIYLAPNNEYFVYILQTGKLSDYLINRTDSLFCIVAN